MLENVKTTKYQLKCQKEQEALNVFTSDFWKNITHGIFVEYAYLTAYSVG